MPEIDHIAATSPASRDLAAWDAVETGQRIATRDVRASEVLEAAIARAEEARPLGAMVCDAYDHARAAASPPDAPFAGVPTFIKDLAHVAGVPTAWGSRGSGRCVPKRSSAIAKRFDAAGFVTLGKSATPEMGLTATTEPLDRAPCRNPWDPTRSTGGSSGGAAALVAAGVVPLAHASDGGGSIRIPAACCGLVGLKPSRGRLDMEGSNLLPINIACDGVVTRTVRDTIAFHAAMETGRVRIGPVADRPGRLRIGAFVDAPAGTPVDPEVQDGVRAAARLCRDLGHDVAEIACPFSATVIDDFLRYWGFVAWIQVRTARVMMTRGFDSARIEPWTRGLMEHFTRAKRATFASMRRLRAFGDGAFADVMGRYDVLLSPTVATPAPPLGHLATDQPFESHFDRVRAFAAFTPVYNTAGAPAISLPLARSRAGLPIGVQFAAARGGEKTLLELALSLEAAQPWPAVAPRHAWRTASPAA